MLKKWAADFWKQHQDLHGGFDLLFLMSVWWVVVSGVAIPSSHLIRLREGIPTGTIIIPDLLSFLKGGSHSPTTGNHARAEESESGVLAIGNSAMPGVSWFAIDSSRKSLVVKAPPDRDLICPTEFRLPETAVPTQNGVEFPEYLLHSNINSNDLGSPEECTVKISIVHGPASNPSFEILTIILEDVNDHAPKFSVGHPVNAETIPHVIRVPETPGHAGTKSNAPSINHPTRNFVRIPLPLANDLDYGVNSIRGYRLEGQDAYLFALEVGVQTEDHTGINSDISLMQYRRPKANQLWLVPANAKGQNMDIVPTGGLDRELRESYHLVLVAFDGGSPQRSARLPISLVVEDLNDNPPIFNQPWYSCQISENDPPGKVVLEFSAYDADGDGSNNKISFHIPGSSPDHIRPNSMVTDKGQMVHEQRATGLSESQLAAAQLFSIEQRNDGQTDGGQFHEPLKSNITHGRLIIRRQPKEQLQNAASRAIAAAKTTATQPANNGFQRGNLPFPGSKGDSKQESGVRLEFVIEAFDHGRPNPLYTRVPVYVTIVDVNDHPPKVFVSYLRHSSSPVILQRENPGSPTVWGLARENLARTMIAQVTVTDEDGAEGDLVCSTNDNRFVLEEIATTGGFLGESRNLWIPPSVTSVIKKDDRSKRTRRRALSARMFKLMLISPLDREVGGGQPNRIEFILTCRDNTQNQLPGEQLTSRVPVRILIEDANDNAPIFEHPEYTFHIPENHPQLSTEPDGITKITSRYFVGQIRANDADENLHALVEYQLVTNPGAAVELNPITGQLYVIRPLDRETTSEVVFQVLAIDCRHTNETELTQTEKRLTGTTQVRIIVDDLNDSPPVFDELNYHFEVEEGTDLAKVGQVWATDADQGEASRISYRLAIGTLNRFRGYPSGTHNADTQSVNTPVQLYDEALEITTHFQIDPVNGLIRVKGRLDRERRSHYEFIVLAVDNPRAGQTKSEGHLMSKPTDLMQHTATTTVLVTVLDQNDNPPQIHSPKNHAEFPLSSDQLIAGSTIFTIKASDPDLGENGTIEFELAKVENDLGTLHEFGEQDKDGIHSLENRSTDKQMDNSRISENPFALDRTSGMCYLRENLPPANSDGPRAYLLRIRAYDLGRPRSLNTSLVVRVVRQSVGSFSQGILTTLYGDHPESLYGGKHERGYSDSSAGVDSKSGSWAAVGQARISDRTMVVILTTVFILLLLTTIVLLLLVRYRRIFLRNVSFNDEQPNDSLLSKANVGYTAGKPFSSTLEPSGSNGILTAPWISSLSLPVESPESFDYSTICNPATRTNVPMTPRMCIKNPSAHWSPCSGTIRRSPGMHHNILAESQLPVLHTPSSKTNESPVYAIEMRSRSQLHPHSKEHCLASPLSRPIEMPLTLLFENYAVRPEQNAYRTLLRDNQASNKCTTSVTQSTSEVPRKNPRPLEFGLLASNTQSPWPTVTVQSTLRRSAYSLEDFHSTLEAEENNCCSKRSFVQSPDESERIASITRHSEQTYSSKTCPTRDEYQPLLTQDCTPLRSVHSSPRHRANNPLHQLQILHTPEFVRANDSVNGGKNIQFQICQRTPPCDINSRAVPLTNEMNNDSSSKARQTNSGLFTFNDSYTKPASQSQCINDCGPGKSWFKLKSNLKTSGKKHNVIRFAKTEEEHPVNFENIMRASLNSSIRSDGLESFSPTSSPAKGIKTENLLFSPVSPVKTASVHVKGSFV
ncbi:hypothetical protein T265_00151 [Opisthorchis viverrini]|uniref:Cadherin domain-containing protein n=1 Tax=Opisthorchis viverrini TaxID=6198 RepID=A0A075A7F2_OPIVI|nr:hypothetical protein T265_00151 [Opisthorchis viverrini]KER34307.1 hypothetical protein T265_00151 [Opisthorchis viverrini]